MVNTTPRGEGLPRRGQDEGVVLVEESREMVVVVDDDDRVVAASRRAREAVEGLVEG